MLKDAEGQYTYTIAVTFENDSHFYPENVTTPEGFTVAADYHTHHENDTAEGQGFSGGDWQTLLRLSQGQLCRRHDIEEPISV